MANEAETTLANGPGKKDVIRNRSVPNESELVCLNIPLQCKTVLVNGPSLSILENTKRRHEGVASAPGGRGNSLSGTGAIQIPLALAS